MSQPLSSGTMPPAWSAHVRDVADFPKPGIVFKDIMPLLSSAEGFAEAVDALAAPWRGVEVQAVVAVEARGFILGAPLARALGAGFVPVRKPGKLPGRTLRRSYALEYGEDSLEMQADALPRGARVLLVDDVLATGGTLAAARGLVDVLGAELAGGAVLIELAALGGRARWANGAPLHAAWTV